MRTPNKNEIRGKLDEAAGTVKEKAGRVTGDIDLQNEGADQRIGGSVEAGFGKARRKISEGLDELGDKLNG
ncbi:MAG TPA: CsbD family protein [Thermoanaerobaculia bacterium]|nr:CsbD family protein [Thermoanaerobaculia bacterium]